MSAENLRFVVSLSLCFALWIVLILYAKKSNRCMWLWGLIGIPVNGLWAIGFMWLPNWDRRRKEAKKAAPALARLLVAVVVLVAIGTAVAQQGAVAQQQPQKPKVHGFKARLCAMSTVPYSPAWDNCMARGFGHPQPSQPTQPAAAAQSQVAFQPQVAPPTRVATPTQVAPPQAKPQEPIVKDTPVQAKTCIEYMTTVSGEQTCLRWKDDQDQ